MKKFIISILIASGIIYLSLSIVWIRSHGWHRPYISWEIRELANYLAENDLSPRGCLDLVWFEIGLSQGEARAECVYNYAKLTKDPSACELLMPSSYGLSCVGEAMSEYRRACALGRDRSVTWVNGGKASLSECVQWNDHACCTVAKARFLTGFADCTSIEVGNMHDQCKRELAFKNANPLFCEDILSEVVKTACKIEASALQRDPGICDGCVEPVNLSELK